MPKLNRPLIRISRTDKTMKRNEIAMRIFIAIAIITQFAELFFYLFLLGGAFFLIKYFFGG